MKRSKTVLSLVLCSALLVCALGGCKVENLHDQEKSSSVVPYGDYFSSESTVSSHTASTWGTYSDSSYDTDYNSSDTNSLDGPELSATCDKVLAFGSDNEGNYYELVANETEDYTGTTITIGVIKNNEWSVNMTSDLPFIGKEQFRSIYNFYGEFKYIGCGCFSYYYGDIINGDNGKIYNCGERDLGSPIVNFGSEKIYVNPNNRENIVILSQIGTNASLRALNTQTMEIDSEIPIDGLYDLYGLNLFFPYSEGLFCCMNSDYDVEAQGFYNLNGEKVIDLSQYKLASQTYYRGLGSSGFKQFLVFENGFCSFKIQNDQNSVFELIIDKEGNVIDSVKVE